ncbi:MAG: hypothetical protein CML02_11250 [Pseudooceanicola sp.]|nr:hypothetical protein [Pseudooceanicola sp.]|tara:strand:- start:4448 stop:5107 length:660 start_codon:yes stop_codon:yes gene_type:complete
MESEQNVIEAFCNLQSTIVLNGAVSKIIIKFRKKMKILDKIAVVLFTFFSLFSCIQGEKKQTVEVNTPEEIKNETTVTLDQFDEEFIDGMTGTLWSYYLEMQMALGNSDVSQTRTVAKYLSESFGDKHHNLKRLSEKLADENDIQTQRSLFSDLSNGLEPIFKAAISAGAIYKIHCPEAMDKRGATWLSNVPKVMNPYGDNASRKCGSVVEIIKKEKFS